MLLIFLNAKKVPIMFDMALANKNQQIIFNSYGHLLYLIIA